MKSENMTPSASASGSVAPQATKLCIMPVPLVLLDAAPCSGILKIDGTSRQHSMTLVNGVCCRLMDEESRERGQGKNTKSIKCCLFVPPVGTKGKQIMPGSDAPLCST